MATPLGGSRSHHRPELLAGSNLRQVGRVKPSSLLKKVFEVSRWATLIQDPSARRTKDSQPSGFGFEYCASHVRFRVFQQTARRARLSAPARNRSQFESIIAA